jgi:hypothetical protein
LTAASFEGKYMKKVHIILLLLILPLFLLPACNKEPEAVEEKDVVTADEEVVLEDVPLINPIFEGSDIKSSPFVGVFKNSYVNLYKSLAEEAFESSDDIPELSVEPSGSYVLKINCFDAGMVNIEGVLSVDGDIATFEILRISKSDFVDPEIENFQFTLANEDEMIYRGESMGTLTSGDIFSRVK